MLSQSSALLHSNPKTFLLAKRREDVAVFSIHTKQAISRHVEFSEGV